MSLSSPIIAVLAHFEPLFTAPTWKKVMNAMMKPLLLSPMHFLASGWCILITVRGRKTGRLYTAPVSYHQEGKVVRFFSGKHL